MAAVTDREPWPLLAALDELLAQEGWQQDRSAVRAMNRRIARETGQSAPDESRPGYLESRDAAALLEEALLAYKRSIGDEPELEMHYFEGEWMEEWHHSLSGPPYVRVKHACEAAVRTRTALEAGWRMGMWPVKVA